MGIRVDWEIENERAKTQTKGEDPDSRKRRGRALRRLTLVLFTLLIIGGCIVGVVMWRLDEVDQQIRAGLVGTVENEVAALRIGDRATFTSIQRSESALWLEMQQSSYDAYQQLKIDANVILSGRVLDVVIDGARGRVQVEEIIDGAPYARTWFYFRYDDGWRHVPPDYTFWGEPRTLTVDSMTITYFAVDQVFVDTLTATLPEWLRAGCTILACPAAQPLNVEIVPDDTLAAGWSDQDSNRLVLPSPFTGAARLDALFSPQAQLQAAALIAERLVTSAQPVQPLPDADAAYLRQAVVSWLVKRFTGQETNAFSIDSLARNYGEAAVGRLLALLTADASMSVLATAAGVSTLPELTLDWRDLLTWRLALEARLISERNDVVFLTLYDTTDPFPRGSALARYSAGSADSLVVNSVTTSVDSNGVPILLATTFARPPARDRAEEVVFRWVDGVWKRAS